MAEKKRKIRADLRKNRSKRSRQSDLTREYREHGFHADDAQRSERVSGKGDLSRKRTLVVSGDDQQATEDGSWVPEVDHSTCLAGTVLRVGGLHNPVQADDGQIYRCATRRLLKTLSTDQRNVLAAGDRVLFRPQDQEGIIERVEPRHGVLCRTSRGRRHVIVANVDHLLIVSSAAEPVLKPNLIDRLLVTAEQSGVRAVVCINKMDLVDAADLQPLIGVYGQLGYLVMQLSVNLGWGVNRLQQLVRGRRSVVVGQSGVGKSSLLNAIEPGLDLKVSTVSTESEKGRHTTTAAQLIPLACGGYMVDTPGIRQFQLWDVIPEELAALFPDMRPLVSRCRFPNCTHLHESQCAVKDAVAEGRFDARRYESYCQMYQGDAV